MRARRAARIALAAAFVTCVSSAHALAQRPPAQRTPVASTVPRFGTMEVGGGVVWIAGWDLDARNAVLTPNVGTGSGFTLFQTESTVKPVAGAGGHFAYYLGRTMAVEAGIQYSQPVVSTRITGDAEDAPDVTAEETMSRYLFTGSFVYHLTGASFAGGRGVPFVRGGAGYLRELHEGREFVETGTEFHAGGGIKYWFGTGRRRLGLRGDVLVSIRDGGFDADDSGRRTLPTVGASVLYLF